MRRFWLALMAFPWMHKFNDRIRLLCGMVAAPMIVLEGEGWNLSFFAADWECEGRIKMIMSIIWQLYWKR